MTSGLGPRIAFTLGALLVYRLGTYIPLPGIEPSIWEQIFRTQGGGLLGMFNIFSGGGIHRMAILALNLTPFLSAAFLLQLAMIVSKRLKAFWRGDERGRQRIVAYTRYLTLLLAVFQAYGIARGLEAVPRLVSDPGWLFRLSTVVLLAGGTMFLVWLSELITARGIGNGIALIFLAGIVAQLPAAIASTIELGRQGALSSNLILGVFILTAVATAFVVFMEQARRRLPIQYAPRQVGTRMLGGQGALSLKLNGSGLIPAIVAPWLVLVPVTVINYTAGPYSWIVHTRQLTPGHPLYVALSALATVVCAFLYTAFLLGPEEVAETLQKQGGVLDGVEPGEATADYVDGVVSRITLIGGLYLVVVLLLPEILIAYAEVPFYFGGMSLLIVVCAIMDIEAQVRGHALIRSRGETP